MRDGFQRRLVGSAGVVETSGDAASCQASLVISERKVEAPAEVTKHLAALEATWQRPDGEELVDVLSKARCARELSCGFYYRWRWPRSEPVAVIEKWLLARKNWHKLSFARSRRSQRRTWTARCSAPRQRFDGKKGTRMSNEIETAMNFGDSGWTHVPAEDLSRPGDGVLADVA